MKIRWAYKLLLVLAILSLIFPYIISEHTAESYSFVQSPELMGSRDLQLPDFTVASEIENMFMVKYADAGRHHSLVLLNSGEVYSFGRGHQGRLGHGSFNDYLAPEKITFFDGIDDKVVSVSAGGDHSLVLTGNGDLYSFGYNYWGQLGHGDLRNRMLPVKVDFQGKKVKVSADSAKNQTVSVGGSHSLVILESGEVFSFGRNNYKQLGREKDRAYRTSPGKVLGLPDHTVFPAVAVSAGKEHSLVLLNNGAVYAFGNNSAGQLGLGVFGVNTEIENGYALKVKGLPANIKATSISAAGAGGPDDGAHSLILLENGRVYSFGSGLYGRLGHDNAISQNLPKLISFFNDKKVVAINAGGEHSLAVDENGRLYAFGNNNYGQLGTGDDNSRNLPVQIASLSGDNILFAYGSSHSLAVTGAGTVYSFGLNNFGQLGHDDYQSRNLPELIMVNPNIAVHPSNRTVTAGEETIFTFKVIGFEPLDFRWERVDPPLLPDEANEGDWNPVGNGIDYSFTPESVSDDNRSWFRCVVSNDKYEVFSNPARLEVLPGRPHADHSSISPPGEQTAGKTISLNFALKDEFGNIVQDTDFPVKVVSDKEETVVEGGIASYGGNASLSMVLIKSGVHNLNVTIDEAKLNLSVTVKPGAVDGQKSSASIPGGEKVAGDDFLLSIILKDKYENLVSDGKYIIMVDSDLEGRLAIEQPDAGFAFSGGEAVVQLSLKKAGEHKLSVIAANKLIEEIAGIEVTPGEFAKLSIEPLGLVNITAGDTINFSAFAKDAFGNTLEELPEINWEGAPGGVFEETKSGNYRVRAAHGEIKSDYTAVVVAPGLFSHEKSSVDDPGVQIAGDAFTVTLNLRDRYDNKVKDSVHSVKIESETAGVINVDVSGSSVPLTNVGSVKGIAEVKVMIPDGGLHTLKVTVNNKLITDELKVTVNLVEADLEIGLSSAQFPDLDVPAGHDFGVIKVTVSETLNLKDASDVEVTLYIIGRKQISPVFNETKGKVNIVKGQTRDFNFNVGNIEIADDYAVTVTVTASNALTKRVVDNFTVVPGLPNGTASSVDDPGPQTSGDPFALSLSLKDIYGNNVEDGNYRITVFSVEDAKYVTVAEDTVFDDGKAEIMIMLTASDPAGLDHNLSIVVNPAAENVEIEGVPVIKVYPDESVLKIDIDNLEDLFPDGIAGYNYDTAFTVKETGGVKASNVTVIIELKGENSGEIIRVAKVANNIPAESGLEFNFAVGEITVADNYSVRITANANNAKRVIYPPGSEVYSFTVVPAAVDSVIIDPAPQMEVAAGADILFKAVAKDEYGNIITDDVADFEWDGADFEWDGADEGCNFKSNAADVYYVSAKYPSGSGGKSSATTKVTVVPGEAETMLVEPVSPVTVVAGSYLIFYAAVRDGFGNLITDDAGDFTWLNANDGIFNETVSGDNEVTAEYGALNEKIAVKVIPGEISAEKSEIVAPGNQEAGVSFTLKIDIKDNWGNSISGEHWVYVESDTDGTFPNRKTDFKEGSAQIQVILVTKGEHNLSVIIDGNIVIEGAKLTVDPGPVDPSNSSAEGPDPLEKKVAGKFFDVSVFLRDAYGNSVKDKEYLITVESDIEGIVFEEEINFKDGAAVISLALEISGSHKVKVSVDTAEGRAIIKDNLLVNVVPGSPDSQKSVLTYSGSGDSASEAGEIFIMRLILRDKYGNLLFGDYSIRIGSSLEGDQFVFDEELTFEAGMADDIEVSFLKAGNHSVYIIVDGAELMVEPITIAPGTVNRGNSIVNDPGSQVAGDLFTLKVELKDSYGNSVADGDYFMEVYSSGDTTTVFREKVLFQGGIGYLTLMLQNTGRHTLTVKVDGVAITDSLIVEVIYPEIFLSLEDFGDSFPDGSAGDDYGMVEIIVKNDTVDKRAENVKIVMQVLEGDNVLASWDKELSYIDAGKKTGVVFDVGKLETAGNLEVKVSAKADKSVTKIKSYSFIVAPGPFAVENSFVKDPGPQTAGDPFNLEINLRDRYDNRVADGNYTVSVLSDKEEVILSPQADRAYFFTNGKALVEVVLNNIGEHAVTVAVNETVISADLIIGVFPVEAVIKIDDDISELFRDIFAGHVYGKTEIGVRADEGYARGVRVNMILEGEQSGKRVVDDEVVQLGDLDEGEKGTAVFNIDKITTAGVYKVVVSANANNARMVRQEHTFRMNPGKISDLYSFAKDPGEQSGNVAFLIEITVMDEYENLISGEFPVTVVSNRKDGVLLEEAETVFNKGSGSAEVMLLDGGLHLLTIEVGGVSLFNVLRINVTGDLPYIIADPEDINVAEGSRATFSVEAGGATPLQYQWQKSDDGITWVNIPGAGDRIYTTPVLQEDDDGTRFRCRVSNYYGYVDSGTAFLWVGFYEPSIVQEPKDQVVPHGYEAVFKVRVAGTPPLNYQWQRSDDDGAGWQAIPGADNEDLVIPEVNYAADNGALFRCLVTNDYGKTVSKNAKLFVREVVVTSISLNRDFMDFYYLGEIQVLIAGVKPDNAVDKRVKWESDDISVATVDRYGKVEAVGVGEAVITVITEDGGYSATCRVRVFPEADQGDVLVFRHTDPRDGERNVPVNKVVSVVFNKNIDYSDIDEGIFLMDSGGNNIKVAVSVHKSLLVIMPDELLDYREIYTVIIPGNSVTDNSGNELAEDIVFTFWTAEEALFVSNVKLNFDDLLLFARGGTAFLVPLIEPENATEWRAEWTSDNPEVVRVENGLFNNGIVYPLTPGNAKITLRVWDSNGEFFAFCNVEVLIYGDVNFDGRVEVADAILILRSIVGLTELDDLQNEAGRVSVNPEISIADAILLLRYVVGLIESFPVETVYESG